MDIKKHKPNILENADFKHWFNSEIFKKCLMAECKGKIDIDQVNTLSFMFATVFAMKARDFVNHLSTHNPGEIEEYAFRCAKNIRAYLLNFPVIKKDWLELFLIGYSGESVLIDAEEVGVSIDIESNIDDQEDEYAKSSLIYTMSLDPNLTESQEIEIIKSFVRKIDSRKRSNLRRDRSRVKKFFNSASDKKKYLKKTTSFKMRAVEYVFRGGVSATLLIMGTKLTPVFGVMAPIALSLAGYAFSPKILDLALEIKSWRKHGNNHISQSQVGNIPKIKKVSGVVNAREVDSLLSLKKKITDDIMSQRRTISEFESKASQIKSAESNFESTKGENVVHQLGLNAINAPYEDVDKIGNIASDLKSKKMILGIKSEKNSTAKTPKTFQAKKSTDKTVN